MKSSEETHEGKNVAPFGFMSLALLVLGVIFDSTPVALAGSAILICLCIEYSANAIIEKLVAIHNDNKKEEIKEYNG